ncbi:MAG: hypothetical protein ACP5G5_04960 [Thermoplasmata archaeon]
MIDESQPNFKSYRGFKQFKNLASAMVISESRSVAHLNGINIDHTNQSNLNMFRSNYDKDGIFNKVCEIVNSVEENTIQMIQ